MAVQGIARDHQRRAVLVEAHKADLPTVRKRSGERQRGHNLVPLQRTYGSLLKCPPLGSVVGVFRIKQSRFAFEVFLGLVLQSALQEFVYTFTGGAIAAAPFQVSKKGFLYRKGLRYPHM
ncbi:hypothetical protein SBA1_1190002 [Candidatus Sulfotelmatobacter kueseliae]|uniref:Uncharacterized protein n=1 Tax=Candidatus Sulfotelmatobacter kueseliae TaxID=2042962 RepID=A0A2U3K1R2_9BACT|nr:hypothetical protein SBA1_1190002 [Candidatus Sulfotelmatobacter kueseliae]